MKRVDSTLVLNSLVDIVSKRVCQQKMLENRRSDVRYSLEMPLPVSMSPTATASDFKLDFKAYAIDISYRGMGLFVDREIAANTVLTLSLMPLGVDDVVLSAKVVYCRHLIGLMFRMGVEFILEDADITQRSKRLVMV